MSLIKGMAAWSWRTEKDGSRPIHVDPTQHGVVVVDAEHHEIHEGHMWHYSYYDLDIDDVDDYDLIITTPAADFYSGAGAGYGPFVHLAGSIIGSGQLVITLYEGAASVVGGTSKTPINRNRNVTGACQTTLIQDPTSYSVASATTLETSVVGTTGNPNQRIGGDARTNIEWLLKPDTIYALNIEPAADNIVMVVSLDFYEHYHKDSWDEESIEGAKT